MRRQDLARWPPVDLPKSVASVRTAAEVLPPVCVDTYVKVLLVLRYTGPGCHGGLNAHVCIGVYMFGQPPLLEKYTYVCVVMCRDLWVDMYEP